jgi:hypothetical protein
VQGLYPNRCKKYRIILIDHRFKTTDTCAFTWIFGKRKSFELLSGAIFISMMSPNIRLKFVQPQPFAKAPEGLFSAPLVLNDGSFYNYSYLCG